MQHNRTSYEKVGAFFLIMSKVLFVLFSGCLDLTRARPLLSIPRRDLALRPHVDYWLQEALGTQAADWLCCLDEVDSKLAISEDIE